MPSIASQPVGPATKPHSAPNAHNQPVPDPIAHFRAIPWCAALLSDPAILDVIVVDRTPLPSGESNFVRRTMNSASTVKACVTFFRMVRTAGGKGKGIGQGKGKDQALAPAVAKGVGKPGVSAGIGAVGGVRDRKEKGGEDRHEKGEKKPLSASTELLSGGGKDCGEDPKNPFLLINALLDLGIDCNGYVGTMHGGLFGVLMDEVMGTAANFQSANGAYTITFTTNFRKQIRLPQVVLVRGRVVKKDGRKLHVRGTIEDKDGNVMAEGSGLWLSMGQNVGRSQL
ncbi:Uu.00g017240.m01.CDS01 [Anthostomella pinea]|uniref:Uu.00g017240.m01.CDS01 n=1 Tax=Anthostomella pinea TaxID=933095 RepID=A0AAI8VZR7_9PEZI|nr:Uu.00g017240.m01.CDS01 [Anthostomella pinea]